MTEPDPRSESADPRVAMPTPAPVDADAPGPAAAAESGSTHHLGSEIRRNPERVWGPAVSLSLHLVFLVVAAVLVIRPGADDGETGTAEVEFATLAEEIAVEEAALDAFELEQENLEVPLDNPTSPSDLEFEATGDPGAMEAMDPGSVETLGGAGQGVGEGDLLGGGGGTSFFGIESRGRRFMYIVDISGSMNTENRIEILKRELVNSIRELGAHAQYYVIAYNDGPRPVFPDRFAWIRANDRDRQQVVFAWIRQSLYAGGGTRPGPAFEHAFERFRPRPDVIYFMTDAQDVTDLDGYVASLNNRGRRTRIHCIAFGDSGSEEVMRRIARDSGGQYRYVPSGP